MNIGNIPNFNTGYHSMTEKPGYKSVNPGNIRTAPTKTFLLKPLRIFLLLLPGQEYARMKQNMSPTLTAKRQKKTARLYPSAFPSAQRFARNADALILPEARQGLP